MDLRRESENVDRNGGQTKKNSKIVIAYERERNCRQYKLTSF
jgi:hypothetical protein